MEILTLPPWPPRPTVLASLSAMVTGFVPPSQDQRPDASPGRPLRFVQRWGENKRLAERVGFEPTLPFRVNTLSKRAPSATRPSLRFGSAPGAVAGKLLQNGSCASSVTIRFYGRKR